MKQLNNEIKEFLLNNTFNNIDILISDREILKLDDESLENKLIVRKRGGYCFENNQYFYTKLKKNGLEVKRVLGRVVYGDTPDDKPRSHQATVITHDDKLYLVDVGFGPYTPGAVIPLTGQEVESFNKRTYRVSKINDVDYQLEIKKEDGFFSLYQFNLANYNDADFKVANYYTNTHDDSKFTTSLILSQQIENGTRFINNLIYSEIYENERKSIDINSAEELYKLISDSFNVNFTKEECSYLFDIVSNF
ncbi:arylamine N-acetyltransferase family protein [Halobacteriovorax sp. RT-2-6]|uniref:arylamine N-acetyltransferase family protein n=1 Tax=unclassified Halobacteriovorax TaxID=2639665 RepID=UPI003999698D